MCFIHWGSEFIRMRNNLIKANLNKPLPFSSFTLFCHSSWVYGLCEKLIKTHNKGEEDAEQGSQMIQYETKCTDKKLRVRLGIEPGSLSTTLVRERRSNRLSHAID